MHFFALLFFPVVNNNSGGRSFPSSIFKLILRVVPVGYLLILFTLLYSTIYTSYRTFVVPLENCSIVSFVCSRM